MVALVEIAKTSADINSSRLNAAFWLPSNHRQNRFHCYFRTCKTHCWFLAAFLTNKISLNVCRLQILFVVFPTVFSKFVLFKHFVFVSSSTNRSFKHFFICSVKIIDSFISTFKFDLLPNQGRLQRERDVHCVILIFGEGQTKNALRKYEKL